MSDADGELWNLLNGLCEQRLTPADMSRLEQLVLSSPAARRRYVTFVALHGDLYWDAVGGLALPRSLTPNPPEAELPANSSPHRSAGPFRQNRRRMMAAVAAIVLLFMTGMAFWMSRSGVVELAEQSSESAQGDLASDQPSARTPVVPRRPVQLSSSTIAADDATTLPMAEPSVELRPESLPTEIELALDDRLPSTAQRPVAMINYRLREGWQSAGVTPSGRADDAAWLRRVHLDLAGHIPRLEDVQRFLADRDPDKRQQQVDRLLNDSAFVRQLTTRWANLLVGRSPEARVNRPALEKFLRMSFAAGQSWDEIVTELVAAEGRSDENGATNFLIAHLNNQAVPATAITARLFLGVQMQCTQCHNHPFNSAQQQHFWEFNSFFQQTELVTLTERDPTTGRMKSQVAELVSQPVGGPTFYETRFGAMKTVYPRYHDLNVSPEPEINRREELARLMVTEDGAQLAAAFVNRTWQQLFGVGFTPQVDDMGPHNPPSHPQLLAELSQAFRDSGYDIKELTRWICLSEAYQLSSQFNETNAGDQPERGETPLFSRAYPQPLSVEQLYDSFLIATKANQQGATDWTAAESQRQAWLKQFIVSFETDENDEANTFEGTVTQALTLMNGPLIEKALDPSTGTFLSEVLRQPGTDGEKIERLYLAALSRKPSSRELTAVKRLTNSGGDGYQDLFWALLNSNEFAVGY
ncbi:MAG: DUF1549 and DUF1553 domain-containing protein [Planctomycetaceae bacterium]